VPPTTTQHTRHSTRNKSKNQIVVLLMIMMVFECRPAALWQYALALAFACCYNCCYPSAIHADAFAPPLPRTTKIMQTPKPFFEFQSLVFSSPGAPRKTVRETDPIHRRRMARADEEGDVEPPTTTTKSSTEGVPSSPLDRPVLSAIDATALFVFAGVGKASHSTVDGSLDLGAVLVTAFPFLVSWFVIAPLVGSYTPEATRDVKSAAFQTAKGWILAVPVGCVLRGLIKGYVPPLPFVVVTLIATLVILGMGRLGYTVLSELYVEMF
jgi:hypothetical protein